MTFTTKQLNQYEEDSLDTLLNIVYDCSEKLKKKDRIKLIDAATEYVISRKLLLNSKEVSVKK